MSEIKAQHTPGPWRTGFSKTVCTGDPAEDNWQETDICGEGGCFLFLRQYRSDTAATQTKIAVQEADARLIAAAPDLLRELQLTVAAMEEGCSGGLIAHGARAAINKATGGNTDESRTKKTRLYHHPRTGGF